ncbi:MAG: N-6 DNA methylase, partial [Myxococcales bacterium]|nr:N-6 DNA methylase [Myxococcales bacterium]
MSAEAAPGAKINGKTSTDAAFLSTIERWRLDIARAIALRNPRVSPHELNVAVQRTLARLIFLRICEDRGMEDYEQLLSTSDDVLPDSSCDFSMLSADILCRVYEQFLGKLIRLTKNGRVIVEDRPEVKKAGGIFYTPNHIVDYIVRKTVGPLVEAKSPKTIAKVRIIDPACGSGLFLISAYQFLLEWHHRWYCENHPQKWSRGKNPTLVATQSGVWALTIAERKRILLAHIYGVDVDAQAVEVAKLSLLLEAFAGGTSDILPGLAENIKCENFLIEPCSINDDFTAVIGNPPYVDVKELPDEIKATLLRD